MCKRLAEEIVQDGFQSKDEPLLYKEPLHDPTLVARSTAERPWGSMIAPKPFMACIAAGRLAYIKGSARVNTFLALVSLASLDNMDLEKDLPSFVVLQRPRPVWHQSGLAEPPRGIITNFKKSCRGSIRQAVALIMYCRRSCTR